MPVAFPGAYGWGAESTGGRGGTTIHVTNLDDSGSGSFREACTTSGARTIVFDVGGTVLLSDKLQIAGNSNVTIAGQTAPGGGICISTPKEVSFSGEHMICRYVRFRSTGANADQDTFSLVGGASNVILDHCSLTWGTDEVLSAVQNCDKITFQWCLIAEASDAGYKASRIAADNLTWHHNLFAQCAERIPRQLASTNPSKYEFINNVSYKSAENGVAGNDSWVWLTGLDSRGDVINNVFRLTGTFTAIISEVLTASNTIMYVEGNDGMSGSFDGDNWADGMVRETSSPYDAWARNADPFSAVATATSNFPVPTSAALTALTDVLADCGATKLLNADGSFRDARDAADQRIVDYVEAAGGAYVDDPADVGGFPTLAAGTAYADADGNGLSDVWEEIHKRSDATQTREGGYTNLELFINGAPGLGHAPGVGKLKRDLAKERRSIEDHQRNWRGHVTAVEAEMRERAREVNQAREKTRTKKVPEGDFAKFKAQPKKKESEGPVDIDIYLHPERKKK